MKSTEKLQELRLKEWKQQNQDERFKFIDLWAKYVREHDDEDWSKQQNVIINSCLRSANITKEQYLDMKAGTPKL
ncbi:hypothetical protein HZA96_02125 [Candidatus Woesearchaeota archaeon]|nr:hypothetical protein [Candidatus Woesearchaeota archaeon]